MRKISPIHIKCIVDVVIKSSYLNNDDGCNKHKNNNSKL